MAAKLRLSGRALAELTAMAGAPVLIDEPMSGHTSFRLGGPADYMCSPETPESLAAVLRWARTGGMEHLVVGAGSNLLVSDKGIRGLVVKTGRMSAWRVDGLTLTAESGVFLPYLSKALAEEGLSGFVEACGIPGSLGGALCMNAGASGWFISDITISVDVIDGDGEMVNLSRDMMGFGPKTSALQEQGLVAARMRARLTPGDRLAMKAKMSELLQERSIKQPLDMASAGCVFKNPKGTGAGRLIDSLGLKGMRIGGALVSGKHANFIVNDGTAKASDVRALLEKVKAEVYSGYGVELLLEVKLAGEWDE